MGWSADEREPAAKPGGRGDGEASDRCHGGDPDWLCAAKEWRDDVAPALPCEYPGGTLRRQ